jgi:hypothetical protein
VEGESVFLMRENNMNTDEIAFKVLKDDDLSYREIREQNTEAGSPNFLRLIKAAEIGIAEGRRALAEELIQLYSCLNLNSETKRTSLRCFLLEIASRPNRKGGDLK